MIYTLFGRFEVNVFDLWLPRFLLTNNRKITKMISIHSKTFLFFSRFWVVGCRPERNTHPADRRKSSLEHTWMNLNETSSKINLLFSLFDVLIRSFIVIIKWMNKSRALMREQSFFVWASCRFDIIIKIK